MSTQVPVDAPWTATRPRSGTASRSTPGSASTPASPQTRKVGSAAFNALFGGEAREISLLYALWYVACAGDENNPGTFERLIDVQGGAQERRLVDGAQSLSLRMAAALGTRVQLSSPVRKVIQTSAGVEVVSDQVTVRAPRAILAVPPDAGAPASTSTRRCRRRATTTRSTARRAGCSRWRRCTPGRSGGTPG